MSRQTSLSFTFRKNFGSEVHQHVNKILLSEIYSKHYATTEFYKEHIKRKEIRATDITPGSINYDLYSN